MRYAVALFLALAACGRPDIGQVARESPRLTLHFTGRVLDADGEPVDVPARVDATGDARSGNQAGLQIELGLLTDAHGRFAGTRWWGWGSLDLDRATARLEMRARDLFCAYEPSPSRSVTLQHDGTFAGDFKLGAKRPTLAVRVVDPRGEPVREYWLEALTSEDPAPRCWGKFADGVANLPIPRAGFRVKAYVGTERQTTVGPFDPADLSARLEIVLPD